MDASPNMDFVTAHSDGDVCALADKRRDERFLDSIFAELCARDHVSRQHEAEFAGVDHDVRERSEYINSPANEIH